MYKAVTKKKKKQDGLNTNLEVFGVLPFAIGGFRSRRGAVACGETLRSLTWRTRSLPDGSFEHVCRMRTSCVSANHLHSCTHPQGLAFSRITQSSPHPPRGRTSEPPFWSGVLFPLCCAELGPGSHRRRLFYFDCNRNFGRVQSVFDGFHCQRRLV